MSKNINQKLLRIGLAVVVALSSTFTPIVANAATLNAQSSITRIGGIDRYETAALMAQKGWTGTSESVVLSAGMNDNLVDALGAGPLAAQLKAPILLTDEGQNLNSFAKVELQRLKPTKVYLTSGTGVIKPSVIEELKGMGINPVQLGGADRYQTSVNIATELALQGVNISRIVLVAGWASPADALSVSSIAASQGMPILATAKDQLPAPVKAYLDSIKANVTESYVVGGTGVVSDAVKGELPGTVSRYSGLTRYDTNVQVLMNFAKDYKNAKVYVANGESLVDAVTSVPLAAANHSPVVLVNQQIDDATREFVKLNMSTDDLVVLGGEGVVSAAGINALTSVLTYATDGVTVGSTEATKLEVLTENVQISGNNVTLRNAYTDYSVYLKGDNVTLSNLNVTGTVFVDPGDQGTATLDGVTAGKIVILSGAKGSIHLNNSTAEVLIVDSRSDVRVESTGTTLIGNTMVRSFAIIDVISGSMGQITILSTPGQSPIVELRGTFTEPVVLTKGTQVHLTASAVLTGLIMTGKASLIVDQGAKVTKFDNRGNSVAITGSGANSIPASSPIALEGSPVTPPVQPPVTPAIPTTPTLPNSVTLSNLRVITDPANSLEPVNNGAEINLSGLEGTDSILGFAVTADQNCTLEFKVLTDNQTFSLIAGQERIITIGDLIIGGQIPGGIDLEDFRLIYKTTKTKTLQGKLLMDGKYVGTLTVKLRF